MSVYCVCVGGERQYLEVEDEAHEGAEVMGWGRGEGRWRDRHEKIIEVRNGVLSIRSLSSTMSSLEWTLLS